MALFICSQFIYLPFVFFIFRDALAIISATHLKAPVNLKVSLSLSEEERAKRKREKELERNAQKEVSIVLVFA